MAERSLVVALLKRALDSPMAPKQADPAETVAKAIAAAEEAAGPTAKAAALEPLLALLADPNAATQVVEKAAELLSEAGSLMGEVAAVPAAELTTGRERMDGQRALAFFGGA